MFVCVFQLYKVQRYKESKQNEKGLNQLIFNLAALACFLDKDDRLRFFFELVDLLMRSAAQ